MKITIPGTLPSLNEMINSSKRSKFAYVKMKNEAINSIMWAIKESIKRTTIYFPTPADFVITWYCPNKRKDKDNVIAGQKFIFDSLQEIGLLKNDGWKEIGSITHLFEIDKVNPRVEVIICESKAKVG